MPGPVHSLPLYLRAGEATGYRLRVASPRLFTAPRHCDECKPMRPGEEPGAATHLLGEVPPESDKQGVENIKVFVEFSHSFLSWILGRIDFLLRCAFVILYFLRRVIHHYRSRSGIAVGGEIEKRERTRARVGEGALM